MRHSQACYCFSSRSRTRCTFPKRARVKSFTPHSYGTQPSTTANSNTHWQHNNCWNCQQHDQTTKVTSNRDEIRLVIRWQKHNDTSNSTTNLASKTYAIIHPNIILRTYINISGHIVSTWKTPQLSYQELQSQALIEGVLKSLGIPTPRNPHYQALAISLVWPTPLSFPVTDYLVSQE